MLVCDDARDINDNQIVKKGKWIMAKSKLVTVNEKIAKRVVSTYKKIEGTVVDGYTRIEDAFIDHYLAKEGETVEEAKERLKQGQNF